MILLITALLSLPEVLRSGNSALPASYFLSAEEHLQFFYRIRTIGSDGAGYVNANHYRAAILDMLQNSRQLTGKVQLRSSFTFCLISVPPFIINIVNGQDADRKCNSGHAEFYDNFFSRYRSPITYFNYYSEIFSVLNQIATFKTDVRPDLHCGNSLSIQYGSFGNFRRSDSSSNAVRSGLSGAFGLLKRHENEASADNSDKRANARQNEHRFREARLSVGSARRELGSGQVALFMLLGVSFAGAGAGLFFWGAERRNRFWLAGLGIAASLAATIICYGWATMGYPGWVWGY